MNHTPTINTPLEIMRDLQEQGNVYLSAKFTRNCGPIQFTDCQPIRFAKIYSTDGTGKDQITYAEFIARACNAHKELLEALKETMRVLRHLRDSKPTQYDALTSDSPDFWNMWDRNKQIIAKAEGKE